MAIRQTIMDQIEAVGASQNRKLAALTDNTPLLETGLDSLCFAILVAHLEDKLGIDPFSMGSDLMLPGTIGEFISLYEHASVR